ncbi:MAG: XdhC family protein [Bacteroidota bacterium]
MNEFSKGTEPYAMAMIVRRVVPSSGKPGDKAIITKKGEIHGWIGGGCTKGIVLKEAMAALEDRKPRLVSITPSPDVQEVPGVTYYKMTCQSGGEVDVYIEPMIPTTHLVIFGRSHIARALSTIAKSTGYEVTVIANGADEDMFSKADQIVTLSEYKAQTANNLVVVVCTQGDDDALSLEKAMELNAGYLAFVSSQKKANSIFMGLKRTGTSIDKLSAIKTPAGLDINAKTPEEVAISILAQIIQEKRSDQASETFGLEMDTVDESAFELDYYINPVCKIPVQRSSAKYVLEHKGEKVYFCCDGCKESFEKEPETYIS